MKQPSWFGYITRGNIQNKTRSCQVWSS